MYLIDKFQSLWIGQKAVLEILDPPKLISRKIWMRENFWNFHTVLQNIWKIETHNKTPSSPSNATLRKYDQSSITLRIIESEEWKKQYLLLLFCSYCYWMVIGSLSKCSEPKVRERIFFVLLPNAIKMFSESGDLTKNWKNRVRGSDINRKCSPQISRNLMHVAKKQKQNKISVLYFVNQYSLTKKFEWVT